jgi:hypothetical protein
MDFRHGKLIATAETPSRYATLADIGLPDLRHDGRRPSGIFCGIPDQLAHEASVEPSNAVTATKPGRYEAVIANWNRYRGKVADAR